MLKTNYNDVILWSSQCVVTFRFNKFLTISFLFFSFHSSITKQSKPKSNHRFANTVCIVLFYWSLVHRKDYQIVAGRRLETTSHRFQLDLDTGRTMDVCLGDSNVTGELCGISVIVFDLDITGPCGPALALGIRDGHFCSR